MCRRGIRAQHADLPGRDTKATAAYRAAAQVSRAGGRSWWLRVGLPGEGVSAARRAGQPVPAGHAPDQVRGVGCGHPGGRDEQRARRGSARGRHRVGRGAEPGLGHPESPGCRTRRAHAHPGRAGRWGPGRRSRRPPAGPARSDRPGPRAAAGARAGRTHPAGRAAPGIPVRCVRPITCAKAASAASTAVGRAPPVARYCTSTAAQTPNSGGPPVSMSLRMPDPRRVSGPWAGSRPHRSAASGPTGHEA